MSNVNSPIYEQDIKRTPTPGGDYNSLLNDSSTNRYITEDFDKIREYSSIDLSEDNTNSLQKLKADNEFLKVQVEIANKEKEMHIQLNAQEKIKTCKQIKHLKLKLQTEEAFSYKQKLDSFIFIVAKGCHASVYFFAQARVG